MLQEFQQKLIAQSETLQLQLSDHSDSLHNALQQAMMSIEAKVKISGLNDDRLHHCEKAQVL